MPPNVHILAAGDVAASGGDMMATANLIVERIESDTLVLTMGDNAYPDGRDKDFRDHYDPSWGRFKEYTRPSPGNHDYHSKGAKPYFEYFGALATPRGKSYYSFDAGEWHLVSLNTEIENGLNSDQVKWLRDDLAESSDKPILAYFHEARFSSGSHGNSRSQRHIWRVLCEHRAEIALAGHDHHYERFMPLDSSGSPNREGLRLFIVGTGGKSLRRVRPGNHTESSAGKQEGAHGVLSLVLSPRAYTWEFIPVPGVTFRDSGSYSTNH